MKRELTNLAASVAARLLNLAKQKGDDYQTVLTSYCLERFLYRLGMSPVRDRYLLKGAMLLRVWSEQPYRATHDLDLLRTGDASAESIRRDLASICATKVAPDAVEFGSDRVSMEAIRAQDESAGTRATLPARCGSARLSLQIDLGVGDSVWPGPVATTYPTLLDFPPPQVLAYSREAVIAEKLEAIVVLGDRNSRIKDYFDLHHFAQAFSFDAAVLTEAARRTFERRRTPIPSDVPIGLTPEYWANPSRPMQVRAFARRAGLTVADRPGDEFVSLLRSFLGPILEDLRHRQDGHGSWAPGGPWEPARGEQR